MGSRRSREMPRFGAQIGCECEVARVSEAPSNEECRAFERNDLARTACEPIEPRGDHAQAQVKKLLRMV
jgi:hypothetical protein